MRKHPFDPGVNRLTCFALWLFFSFTTIKAIYFGVLYVPLLSHRSQPPVIVRQNSDPAVFWGIVIFMALMAAILFYGVFFAKDPPTKK